MRVSPVFNFARAGLAAELYLLYSVTVLAEFSLPSFAKINLILRILGKRDDDFHELFTVFQTISLHDTIAFAESDKLELTCDHPFVPTDDRNLIIKAAKALIDTTGENKGARLRLSKRIPTPGGLGGGSSNAAVALIGLNRLWESRLPASDLQSVGESLGADVPFFLHGGLAIGTGRGENIEEIDDVSCPDILIVTPKIRVSTRIAFARIDAQPLTIEAKKHILPVCRIAAGSLDPYQSALTNDFEASVFTAFPEIERVERTLLELGAVNAGLSGSGASVFAIFDKKEARQTALKALDREVTWRKFAVSAISRASYREALQL